MRIASPNGSSPVGFSYQLIATDPSTRARRGRIQTRNGSIETPVFMPVGTQATIKTLHPHEVARLGAQIVLANTYHLMLRPGPELIDLAGGLHPFMCWDRPILTDSGGFQIFSLAQQAKVSDDGVRFRSHIDGSLHMLTPERAVDIQAQLGSDIMMALDHLIGLPAKPRKMLDATLRTHRWLDRCIAALAESCRPRKGVLFGICQGGMDPDLRRLSAQYVAAADVSGIAIGGLSVGETKAEMAEMLDVVVPELPEGKPRYLMGVGSPEDLWNGVAQGVDMFDCVLPTRLARNGSVFTPDGRIDLHHRSHRESFVPIDDSCDCETCAMFDRAYLHHLFRAREILGLRLASVHNLRFLVRQMETMRIAIEQGAFESARSTFLDRYRVAGPRAESAA
ncbi:MAG: tRNA guanosine(34) transglycosylase Tgt [Thermomicrobiales bacterium]